MSNFQGIKQAGAEDAIPEDAASVLDDSPRGRQRPTSASTAKEPKDKGNVVISVRVRPEKDSHDGSAEAGEWLVEGKKSAISYRGKEGGEYVYGE